MNRPHRLFFGLLALGAVGWQLVVHLRLGFPVLNFFSYFTNLGNLFAAGVLLAAAGQSTATAESKSLPVWRLMAVIYMTIVGVVFAILLRNEDLGALRPWVNFVVHTLMPCVVLVDWLVWPPRGRLGWPQLGVCLVPPLLYLAYTVARGAAIGWYPYPFLNPAQAGGYGGVALYAAGITAVFFGTGLALIWASNRRWRANSTPVA